MFRNLPELSLCPRYSALVKTPVLDIIKNLSGGHLGLEEDESHSQLTVNLFEISSPLNLTTEQLVIY
jgi:hypothetical protein